LKKDPKVSPHRLNGSARESSDQKRRGGGNGICPEKNGLFGETDLKTSLSITKVVSSIVYMYMQRKKKREFYSTAYPVRHTPMEKARRCLG
jgi:hypothetical protein